MGLLDRPVRNGFDRMFDYNRDGVLDPGELDAQECFLHDVNTFDEIVDEEDDEFDEDDFDEDDDWDEDDWDEDDDFDDDF